MMWPKNDIAGLVLGRTEGSLPVSEFHLVLVYC